MHRIRPGVIIFVILIFFTLVASASGVLEFVNPKQPLAAQSMSENANSTGQYLEVFGYARNLTGQPVHGGYLGNTNSCASCHVTHTAGGEGLVFQSSTYNTCVTCHTGNHSPYDVLNGSIAAGRFYDSVIEANSRTGVSYHLTTGAKKIGDAPGAFLGADSSKRYTRRDVAVSGYWDSDFTCASCHVPHGTYSSRLLHFNTNGQGKRYTRPVIAIGDDNYRVDELAYLPWAYYNPSRYPQYAVYVNDSGGADITSQFTVNYASGELYRKSGSTVPSTVSFIRSTVVSMQVDNKFRGNESVTHTSGIVEFCTSCHVGYYDENASNEVFAWHNNFYHEVNMNVAGLVDERVLSHLKLEERAAGEKRLTCLTCHFAHGTDAALMQKRNTDWWGIEANWSVASLTAEEQNLLSNTASLRFVNPSNADDYSGRYESCYLCHETVAFIPQVTNATPAVNQEDINPTSTTEVVLEFNLLMNMELPPTITVKSNDNVEIAGTVTVAAQLVRFTFNPEATLDFGKTYTVTVTNARARVGGVLANYNYQFKTKEPEVIEPEVIE